MYFQGIKEQQVNCISFKTQWVNGIFTDRAETPTEGNAMQSDQQLSGMTVSALLSEVSGRLASVAVDGIKEMANVANMRANFVSIPFCG